MFLEIKGLKYKLFFQENSTGSLNLKAEDKYVKNDQKSTVFKIGKLKSDKLSKKIFFRFFLDFKKDP